MSAILSKLGGWLLGLLVPILESRISAWITSLVGLITAWLAARKQKQVDAANVEKVKTAVQSGDLNAIAAAGTDALNGTEPKP